MLRYLLELSKSEPDDEEVDKVLPIVLTVVQDERIQPSHGELIAIVAFSLGTISNNDPFVIYYYYSYFFQIFFPIYWRNTLRNVLLILMSS